MCFKRPVTLDCECIIQLIIKKPIHVLTSCAVFLKVIFYNSKNTILLPHSRVDRENLVLRHVFLNFKKTLSVLSEVKIIQSPELELNPQQSCLQSDGQNMAE